MKYSRLLGMMVLVTLCSLFLFSSDSGANRNTDREKAALTITVPDINLLELELFDNFNVLSELDLRLEGLEERISELVEMELENLDFDIHLDGLEESLNSLGDIEGLVELECLKALEDLDLETKLSDFFDNFDWEDFVFDFDWDWDFDPDPDWN